MPTLSAEHRIDRALAAIAARFGPAIVRRLRDAHPGPAHTALPSGSLGLDRATGLGGLPRGHVTELLGPESSGKTALLYAALAAAQARGGLAALIDAEGSADADALAACGVAVPDLLIARPASAPDALLMLTILARCRALDALGFLAGPALRDLPAGRVRGDALGDLAAPDAARLLARGLRVLAAALADGPTAVLLVNDLLPPRPGQPPHRSPGGLALRHHAALRVAVEPRALLPDGAGGFRALRVELTVVKHKLGTPGGVATVEIAAGGGIDTAAELLHLGLATGLLAINPSGLAWDAVDLGPDESRARRRLAADPALADRLRRALTGDHDARPAA